HLQELLGKQLKRGNKVGRDLGDYAVPRPLKAGQVVVERFRSPSRLAIDDKSKPFGFVRQFLDTGGTAIKQRNEIATSAPEQHQGSSGLCRAVFHCRETIRDLRHDIGRRTQRTVRVLDRYPKGFKCSLWRLQPRRRI